MEGHKQRNQSSMSRLRSDHSMSSRTGSSSGSSSTPAAVEVIESHFVHDNAVYFVVNKKQVTGSSRERQYYVKPLWYVCGTPALHDYYLKLNSSDKLLVPASAGLGDKPHAAEPCRKRSRERYHGTIESRAGSPQAKSIECLLNIPPNWGQLAHYRLLHYNVDRILTCAVMPTGTGNESTTVYVVLWQNEPEFFELVPVDYLHSFRQHTHHQEVALDYWEDACIPDSRMFQSAASVDYLHQSNSYVSGVEDFWVEVVHKFRARSDWINGRKRRAGSGNIYYVKRWVGWPLTISQVTDEPTELDNNADDEEKLMDPVGYDEYVDVTVHDKFIPNADGTGLVPVANFSREQLKEHGKCDPFTVYVPAKWMQLAREHAASYKKVKIEAIIDVKESLAANVYLVKWKEYAHPTMVPSLTLRKRHGREMLKFLQETAYLPQLMLTKAA